MTQRRKEVEREGPGVSWWLFSSSLSLPFVFQRELLVCESLADGSAAGLALQLG